MMTSLTGPVVGIDLGGTYMQIGVVDQSGAIIAQRHTKTNAQLGQDAVIARIVEEAHGVCADAGCTVRDLDAVGVAAPGAIDMPNAVVIEAVNLRWNNTPLGALLERELECPIMVDNDVNAATWGEYRQGAGRAGKHHNALGIWVGTGVGGGIVLDDRLYHGPLFTAGEIGQTVICTNAKEHERLVEDVCSRSGMARLIERRLEDSPTSILHKLLAPTGRVTSSAQLKDAYEAEDPLTVSVVDRAAEVLGITIANWVTVLAVDLVIVGGGVAETFGEPFLERVRAQFERDVFPASNSCCELRLTELCNTAGLVGAALLARELAVRS